ncbi:hypothetical protein GIB67_004454 [Kingdonia uniflora]|uniref:Cytochrome P450 n=1 Tax=Kingdonia uniflora TaxID=39325 RepID=A0A7J7MRK5_9MAGN|nr:hypothetical protein GIB67_004454 [Kingdonia uniflora]
MLKVWSFITVSDVVVAIFGLFVFSSILQRVTKKGPMLWPMVGIIPTLFFQINEFYDWITDALIKAGGTFQFRGIWFGGAYGIVTVDPSTIEYMLKTNFKNFPKGKYYRERFSDLLGDGIFNADGDLWKEQRRVASSEMHSTKFLEYSRQMVVNLVHQKLLKVVNAKVGEIVDLQDIFLRFTFDNICSAAFGVNPGCLAIDLPVIQFARAFEQATEFTLFRFIVPPFVWKVMRFFKLGSEKRLKEASRVVHEFATKTVYDRRVEYYKLGSLDERSDLLSRLVEVDHEYNSFSDNFLKDFCISFILAGRDTSSVALAWFFWLVNKHLHVEKLILNELSMIRSGRNMDELVFTIDDMKKMEYLQAALSESLRLYPSVPINFKEVQEEDILPNGTLLRKGARVFYCIFSMARMEAIWGKDCKEFKPERWMKDGKFVDTNQYKYPVFNGGPRLCVGKKFAFLQMKMVVSSIMLRYKVGVVEGQCVVPKITTTLYMKNGLLVTFKPRLC